MNTNIIADQFARMGARFKVSYQEDAPRWRVAPDYALDIRRDRRGEFFELRVPQAMALDVCVMQAEPRDRHLLLLVKKPQSKDRFLCGHDEREWFVAAVPGGASSVAQAKAALKPAEVLAAESRARLTREQRQRRRNRAFIRQGEWFFVPVAERSFTAGAILRREPIRRGGGKAHLVEEVCRVGGETVWVCREYPNGLAEDAYRSLLDADPGNRKLGWTRMTRNAAVYARGAVRHPDHRTITLRGWHRVLMNTEAQSRTMANVAFLD